MFYKDLLKRGMQEKGLSLRQTTDLIEKTFNLQIDASYLSKLRSGDKPPASDKVNDALAVVLGIEPVELKVAAYSEKIPPEVLEHLNRTKEVG
ncbi:MULTISPECIES: helix-turn-helix domain-containing protein [Paenibacillus]|uniref:helix-turn-helix domain-containing protein n=1 Tax=Paenibacillus TaxID=44249 RepID=UPI00096FB54F|nr:MULTISPECIES: helix-turn-helix domain-containing protein [Paenibacillus]OMF31994.1 hypothetical protein BK134_13080 [Paenibacillus peoriae]RPE10536.1 XRE family transcriptional regulator [Paenibacillus polymyxa]